MRLNCPACRKLNEFTGAADAACVRCGCDLRALAEILEAADRHLRAAGRAFRQRDWSAALDQASFAWELRHSSEAARLAGLASAALGQTEALLHWRARAGR